jgi:hypothetical protein
MRKALIGAIAGLLLAAGASAAVANPPEDENRHQPNDHGLCTAWSHIPDQAKKAPPFQDLVDRAGGDEDDVADFCAEATPGNKG